MRIGAAAFAERVRASLFVVPMLCVIGAIALAETTILVDDAIGTQAADLPLGLTSTVESARAVLSTIAGATITVAAIAFSVSLLTIQLASSQYSPRVLTGIFRDPFNKGVIGVVVGTFTYCLIVLRSVRSAVEQQGDAFIPNVSVAIGVILGIASILAVIAFIDHSAHTMDISEILHDVTGDAVEAVGRDWSEAGFEPREEQEPDTLPQSDGFVVRSDRDGWVQLIDLAALMGVVPDQGTMRVEIAVGRYVVCGAPVCTIWPAPVQGDDAERAVRRAVRVGETRTLQQDASYGLRQLADVALRALSPGVNDPTTAQDAIFHIASVLRAFLDLDEPVRDLGRDGRRLVLAQAGGHAELVGLAYDEIRRAAASQPAVSIYLLESIALLQESLPPGSHEARRLLDAHARLVLEATRRADPGEHDRAQVERVYSHHFPARVRV